MPLSQFRVGSKVPVHAGARGMVYRNIGGIYFRRGCKGGVDGNLFGALKVAVDEMAVTIRVNSLCTGKHAKTSRHYAVPCLAADIDKIGHSTSDWATMTATNPLAIRWVDMFLQAGWVIGEGRTTEAGLLLGPPHSRWNSTGVNHSTHLHLSCARRAPGSARASEEPEEEEWDGADEERC